MEGKGRVDLGLLSKIVFRVEEKVCITPLRKNIDFRVFENRVMIIILSSFPMKETVSVRCWKFQRET